MDQSPVKQADITLNQSFGIGNTDFYLKVGDLKEFRISAELSDIFSISTETKRKTNMMEPETEESKTKYDRLLQNILEKAITCDHLIAFINNIQADLSSILAEGSLFFINRGEWFTLLNQLQLTGLQSIKQLLKDSTKKQGNLIYKGTTLYYRAFESKTHTTKSLLLFFSHQKLPVSTSIFDTFLNKLIEIIEFHLKIIPGVSFKLDLEPVLYHEKEISIIGSSSSMKKTIELARRIASKSTFILIMGESGTGKELIAKMIHRLSGRKKYIALNCAAIPANLLESELSSITASCKNKKLKTTVTDSSIVREKSFNPERERILKLLEQNKGNKAKTARDLGMSYRGGIILKILTGISRKWMLHKTSGPSMGKPGGFLITGDKHRKSRIRSWFFLLRKMNPILRL